MVVIICIFVIVVIAQAILRIVEIRPNDSNHRNYKSVQMIMI